MSCSQRRLEPVLTHRQRRTPYLAYQDCQLDPRSRVLQVALPLFYAQANIHTVSKRIALLALVPLVYSIFRHEMEAILEGKHSTYVQPKKARALKVNKAPEGEPGMAMSYLYQPSE
jgi:hypothetical protein